MTTIPPPPRCETCHDVIPDRRVSFPFTIMTPDTAELAKLISYLEKMKPQPYCIGTVDSFEEIEELRQNPLHDEVVIFPEAHRHFCVELFKGWDEAHQGVMPKLLALAKWALEAKQALEVFEHKCYPSCDCCGSAKDVADKALSTFPQLP